MEAAAAIEIQSDEEDLTLYNNNTPFRLNLRITSFEEESEFKKFI